ncbi:hypothetical protein QFZ94_002118 [Paraburkholderia sp. JPY465]|uniref:hypothetical protein n=1 Tax=Paraburkholderia sp. JPY465 TaxID=3042285 RepID=UPI003D19EE24
MADWLDRRVDEMRPQIERLEKELQLPEAFFERLRVESDWSFVIKLHAVFEAVIVQALTGHLGQDCLADAFGYLDMSNVRSGKVAFARALGLLDAGEARFLAALSTLRNDLVHKVRNVGFSFDAYIKGLNTDQLNKFAGEFTAQSTPKQETSDWRQTKELMSRRPKDMIWFVGTSLLCLMFLKRKIAVYEHEKTRTNAALYEKHIEAQKQPTTLADLFKFGPSGDGLLSGRSEPDPGERPKADE